MSPDLFAIRRSPTRRHAVRTPARNLPWIALDDGEWLSDLAVEGWEEIGTVQQLLDGPVSTEPGTPIFGVPDARDPMWLATWARLPDDVCMISGCNATEVDQRGPVWLRGGGMGKACPEHWEPIMRVLGEQATWERTDAYHSAEEAS